MSDYLGNLLKRSFAPVAEVQPRVPSFFEPMSASVLAASPGDSDVEAKAGSSGEVQPGTGERNFQPTPHNTRHTWLGEAAIIHPEDEPREQSPTPFSKTKPALRPLERTAVVSPDRAADKKTEPTVVPRITVIQPRTPVEPPELNHASPVGEPTLLPQAPPTKASRKTPAPEQSSVSAPRATSKVDERNKIRFGEEVRPPSTAKAVEFRESERPLRPQVTGIRPAPPPLQNLSSKIPPSTAPPPGIHVTIGRVEVRASLPPASPRFKRATTPVLNLEDYLRGRAQERRR